jgi:hypothetical protein
VNTAAARYQNLSINQTKLSGQCGRLKCCLNYELDTYLDALQGFPENADMLQVTRGTATLIKKDIFKNLMWYVLPDSNKQYPLTIERVRKIRSLNTQNIVPEELEAVEVTATKPKDVEPEFVDVVGHISLRSLEKGDKKRSQQRRDQRPQGPQQQSQRTPQKGIQPQQQRTNDASQQPQQKRVQPPQKRQPSNNGATNQNNPQKQRPQNNRPLRPQQPRPNKPPQNDNPTT